MHDDHMPGTPEAEAKDEVAKKRALVGESLREAMESVRDGKLTEDVFIELMLLMLEESFKLGIQLAAIAAAKSKMRGLLN